MIRREGRMGCETRDRWPRRCGVSMMASGATATVLDRAPLLIPPRRADLMSMAAPVYYSADMVRALPDDGNRYETVHGELLVTPSPRLTHQLVVRRLLVALDLYLRDHPVGTVLPSPADISW